MPGTTSVFVTSCETGDGAWRDHEVRLKEFHELSDKRYKLAADPESADIILIGNVREENWGEKILANPLINRWPAKCFSLSDQDFPLVLNHGIYASGTKSLLGAGRVRSGSYSAYPIKFQNPFGRNHVPSEADFANKKFLLSFVGRNSDKIRARLFSTRFTREDILVEDSSHFDLWDVSAPSSSEDRQRYYIDVILRSKFSICPRGAGTSSLRLFESMRLGVAPVIISGQWVVPKGPRWGECSIFIKEKNLGELESIVLEHEADFERMGRAARANHDEFFADSTYFNYVVDTCLEIRSSQLIPEAIYWRLNPCIIFAKKRLQALKNKLRSRG